MMDMDKQVRAILVGCGGISRTWLEAAQNIPQLELVGLVDLDLTAAERQAEEFNLGDVLLETDLNAALDSTQPDVVFDCTVPEAHVKVTLAALGHGCHVLGEKPLADTPAHAQMMINAAQAAGKTYAVMQNRRFHPQIRRLVSFLRSGAIGAITTVHCDFFLGAHFGGFRDRMAHVLLLDMAIHTFDQARLITGSDPRAVYCHEWNPAGSWYDHDASAIATFEMSDNLVYTYRGSWCAEGLNTSWESAWRIIGERGSVIWDGGDNFAAQVVAESGGFISEMRDITLPPPAEHDKVGGHAGLIRDFVDCVSSGTTPETIASDNVKSLAMVFGAIESAERQQRVQIDSA